MEITRFARTSAARKTVFALIAVGAALAVPALAGTLSFTSMPATNAAAEISRRYGVSIVFRGTVNGNQPVTFTVDNADTPDGRLQAVNDLANALNLDFQKVYVVSKVDPGTKVPEVKIDNNDLVVFSSVRVPAREAIQTVAGVDSALTQIGKSVTGTVTLPRTRLTATEAAAIIARQTGTVWHAYYGLFPRGQEPARLKGEIIDRDASGQAITASPLLTFRVPATRRVPTNGSAVQGGSTANVFQGPDVTTVPNTSAAAYPGFGYGYGGAYGYGNPYGFDPYGYSGFGYPAPNGGFAYPGSIYTPGAGVEPVLPGYNAPGYFDPGVGVTSVPTVNNTILPDFPYSGGVGGQMTVGGY